MIVFQPYFLKMLQMTSQLSWKLYYQKKKVKYTPIFLKNVMMTDLGNLEMWLLWSLDVSPLTEFDRLQ